MKSSLPFVLLAGFFALPGFSRAADPPATRVIHGTVLNLDGSPAAGRQVQLIGLSRGSARSHIDDDKFAPGWDFQTDQKGRFTATLGEYNTWENKEQRPGWGNYVFVVTDSPSDAGAVSPHLLNFVKKLDYYDGDPTAEWGAYQLVPPGGLDLVLQIKAGVTVEGRVLDYPDGKGPLPGVQVFAFADLYSESHTGRGGEVFLHEAMTARDGSFILRHVYPAKIYMGLGEGPYFGGESNVSAYWLKSRRLGLPWQDAGDVLEPEKGVLHIDIMAAREPIFEYHGRVVDEVGKPVAGAPLCFGVSHHPTQATFTDDHSFKNITTRDDGSYDIFLPTPWVRFISVRDDRYSWSEQGSPDDAPSLRPGTYDFMLKAKKKQGE